MRPAGSRCCVLTGPISLFPSSELTDIRTAFWVVSKDPASFGKRSERFVLGDKNSNDFHAGWTNDTIFNTDVNPGHLSKLLKDGKTWLNGQSMDATKTPFPKQLSLISIVSAGPSRAGQLARDRNMWRPQLAGRHRGNPDLQRGPLRCRPAGRGEVLDDQVRDQGRRKIGRHDLGCPAGHRVGRGIGPGGGKTPPRCRARGRPSTPSSTRANGTRASPWNSPYSSCATARSSGNIPCRCIPKPGGIQEFDDATLLSNGNIIFSRMSGAGMVSPDKQLVWEYPAPAGTEIHSCQSIGKDRVLIMRNGNPAQAMIINTATNKMEKEIPIPTTVTGTHGQFRHIRMTKAGTILVPHMGEGKVVEYDLDGKVVWSVQGQVALVRRCGSRTATRSSPATPAAMCAR